jgi:hypothetical protein
MNELFCKAINGSRLLGFTYKGLKRWVEPHTYGSRVNGGDGICAWQTAGGSGEGFRLFVCSEMGALEIGEPFDGSRPGYRRGDSRFVRIYAEL